MIRHVLANIAGWLLALVLAACVAVLPGAAEDSHSAAPEIAAGQMRIVKPVAPRNLLARRSPGATPVAPAARNAIGVKVVRPEGLKSRGDTDAVAGASAVSDRPVADRLQILEQRNGRVGQAVKPLVRPTMSAHGGINGTELTRRNSVPAAIGGPARADGGISGTTIRPKHSAGIP
jgi:hypothetical protein